MGARTIKLKYTVFSCPMKDAYHFSRSEVKVIVTLTDTGQHLGLRQIVIVYLLLMPGFSRLI